MGARGIARVHAVQARGRGPMRGSRLSCVLCALLSMFMVMPASVASAATDGSGGSGEVTIHYYDSDGWTKPFAYMYGNCVRSASWPGERMTDDGDGWYGNDVVETLRSFQKEHAGTGVRIVYKIAK